MHQKSLEHMRMFKNTMRKIIADSKVKHALLRSIKNLVENTSMSKICPVCAATLNSGCCKLCYYEDKTSDDKDLEQMVSDTNNE